MNNIPMKHTIELMKNRNNLQEKIVDFIKNADLYMDDFKYVDIDKIQVKASDEKKDLKKKHWIFLKTLWTKYDWCQHIRVFMFLVCCLIPQELRR